MTESARAGALIYAQDLERLSTFYQQLLAMEQRHADSEHHVLESSDFQLIIHALPPQIAATFAITAPPVLRESTAIKLFFTVTSLSDAALVAQSLGGEILPSEWLGSGFRVRNGYDPEGNIFQLRESVL